jgi:hypothetical protein
MITTTAQNGRTLADLTTHAVGPGVSDKLRSFRKPTDLRTQLRGITPHHVSRRRQAKLWRVYQSVW